jgi:predicted nucleotidyltransferase
MNDKIKNIIKKALKGYTIEKIILFGSRARGDFNDDSDYDLYIILTNDLSRIEKVQLTDKILEQLAINRIWADVLIRSKSEFEVYKTRIGAITRDVVKEGIEI